MAHSMVLVWLVAALTAPAVEPAGGFDVARQLKGAGDETAAFRAVVAAHRHVRIPAGFAVTISGGVPVPPGTLIEGPGTIHLTARDAGLRLGERCTVRDVTFTCALEFAHGSAIMIGHPTPGTVRKMDCRVSCCRFERMRGHALFASEVSHIVFEDNYWENHSPNSLFFNPTHLQAVNHSMVRGNTLLNGNQAVLFRGGSYNTITGNYIENALQAITCHTVGSHPQHWPFTLFAHNVIANNVIRRHREEGIAYDNSMGETPAVNAAQNQVRAVATVKTSTATNENRFRITLNAPANPGKAYAPNWADHYYVGFLTGSAAGMLLEVVASGVDGDGFIDLPRLSADLPGRIKPGDRVWVAAGCFYNTVSGNVVDNTGEVSGGGNATCIGLWGAAWHNQITGNTCTTRQYGITLGCVGLGPPESPQGPSVGNSITSNTIAGSWRSATTKFEDRSVGAIAYCWIGEGPLLGGRMFLGNSITHNTISWAGKNAFRLGRDRGSYVAFNRVSDDEAVISLDHTSEAAFEGNRTMSGALVQKAQSAGPCTYRFVGAAEQGTPATRPAGK